MKKSFIAAAIVGFATLGTAQASETKQDMHFMNDDEMHEASGAKLGGGYSKQEAWQWTIIRSNTNVLTKQNRTEPS
jgi:hypothetical protein